MNCTGVTRMNSHTPQVNHGSCGIGAQVSHKKLAGQSIPLALGLKYRLAIKLVFSKIHKALGGNVKWCISGAAPLNPEIARFFHAAGL